MFIIIEGPDNSGKSTLIAGIKNHFNDITFQTLHYSNVNQPNKEQVQNYSKKIHNEMFSLMEFISQFELSGVICDRSHLGEMIYGPIYRGYTGEYVLDIERNFIKSPIWDNLILITLVDTAENLIDRDDGLSFSTDINKKITEIQNFQNAHDKSLIKNKLLLNIEGLNKEKTLEKALSYIKKIYKQEKHN